MRTVGVVASCLPVLLWSVPLVPPDAPRAAVPPELAVQAGVQRIRERFKDDYSAKTPAAWRVLAEKLLEASEAEGADRPFLYAILSEAREFAARAGDARLTFRAIHAMSAVFDIDGLALKQGALEVLLKTAEMPRAARDIAEVAVETVGDAMRRDAYDAAKKLVSVAATASRSSREPSLIAIARDLGKVVSEREKRFKALQASLKLIEKEPKNAKANLEVGKFRCFIKEDWPQGLPCLALGGSPALTSVATKDLARPEEPEGRAEVAVGWWLAGDALKGTDRAASRCRSAFWYALAAPGLKGVALQEAVSRMETVANDWDGWSATLSEEPPGFAVVKFNGEDLRGLTPISGTWRVARGELVSSGDKDHFLASSARVHWLRVRFQFQGGNPGLYFNATRTERHRVGVNLDSDGEHNGEIRMAVDDRRWNEVIVDFQDSSAHVRLNGEKVYDFSLAVPAHIIVKAQRGDLRIRQLVGFGYNP